MDEEATEQFSAADLARMKEAVCGAIGWIAATTNEGNNQTSKWTREHLVIVNRLISQHGSPQAQAAQDSQPQE